MSKYGITIVASVAGILAGISSSLILQSRRHGPSPLPADSFTANSAVPSIPADGRAHDRASDDQSARIRALEREIQNLAVAQSSVDAAGPRGSREEHESPSAAVQLEAGIQRHHESPINPRWASIATTRLTDDLETLGRAHGFDLAELECRSTSCLAVVRFGSYAAASASWRGLVHEQYRVNCMRTVLLPPPPPDPSASFSLRLFLDCADPEAALRSPSAE